MRSPSQADAPAANTDVAATVRLLHRRDGWRRLAITSFLAFVLLEGAYYNAQESGTPPPFWFLLIVIGLGALTVVGIAGAVTENALLRRRSPEVRSQAAPLAARHRARAHHFPPRHRFIWALRWIGMLLILMVAVLSLPAIPDGVAYLAGAGKTVTFDPVSYQTNCYQGGCHTSTDGILETGGTGTEADWPAVVPLGQPFKVRAPVWRWGLGGALIDSNVTAALAIVIGVLLEGFGILVAVFLVRLVRNWRRHRQQLTALA